MVDQTQRNIRVTIILIIVFMVILVAGFVNRMLTPRIMHEGEMKVNGLYLLKTPRIIKPFELVDEDNQPFTLQQLEGKWTLAFFGFTYCPDICPTTLATLKRFKDFMGDSKYMDDTQVLLVTTDPARDTPDKLNEYLEFFDPEFKGVTGDFMALQSFATNLNAAFTKVPLKNGDYTIDHTANVVLINPYGHYHAFFKSPIDATKVKITYQSVRRTFD
jgi:protein SCO1/2